MKKEVNQKGLLKKMVEQRKGMEKKKQKLQLKNGKHLILVQLVLVGAYRNLKKLQKKIWLGSPHILTLLVKPRQSMGFLLK